MPYRTMPVLAVPPPDLERTLRRITRRFWAHELRLRLKLFAIVFAFCAGWLAVGSHRREMPWILGLAAVAAAACALRGLSVPGHLLQPSWQVDVEDDALRIRAYDHEALLPLAAVRSARYLILREDEGPERLDRGVLVLRLVDGSRFRVPEGASGFGELRLALEHHGRMSLG